MDILFNIKSFIVFTAIMQIRKSYQAKKKPSIKLNLSETALSWEKNLPAPVKLERFRISNPNDCFMWWDLIYMCISGKKYSYTEVYEAIQTTIVYIQKKILIWILKYKDLKNRLYFDMGPKLKIAKFEIKIIEYGVKQWS